MIPCRKSTKKYQIKSVNVPSVSSTVQFIKIWSGFAQFYLRKNRHYEPMNIHSRNDLAARHIELDKIESHCPGPKMRNQDPRGRRGQPLQDREPLPGAEDEESRRRPAWALLFRSLRYYINF